jgi:hypothetical protein
LGSEGTYHGGSRGALGVAVVARDEERGEYEKMRGGEQGKGEREKGEKGKAKKKAKHVLETLLDR